MPQQRFVGGHSKVLFTKFPAIRYVDLKILRGGGTMRILIIAISFLFSASAFANSFNNFVGKYDVEGDAKVENVNAGFCNRFNFKEISSFEVKKDTEGYKQSHMLYFHHSYGWSGHPVMDFKDKSEFDPSIGTYAKTTGSSGNARNEYGSFGLEENDRLTVSIARAGSGYTLAMAEELIVRGTVTAACYYEVNLR